MFYFRFYTIIQLQIKEKQQIIVLRMKFNNFDKQIIHKFKEINQFIELNLKTNFQR
jgi:hypothetical protein